MKKILFPVVQDISSKLVPTVKRLAGALDAEIHVLHIVQPTDPYIESRIKTDSRWLDSFIKDELSGVDVYRVEVIPGDPADEIIKYGESQDMDLIVLGTHGRKGVDRFYFGNVAEKVVAKSSVPVLSINPLRSKIRI